MCHFQTEQLCEQISDVEYKISNTQDDTSVHGYKIGDWTPKAGTEEFQPWDKD